MAGWYIRRDEKVIGPVEITKLKELVVDGRLRPTDFLAKDPAGPWTAASRTTLFAKLPSAPSVPATTQQTSPAPLAPIAGEVPVEHESHKSGTGGALVFGASIGRSVVALGSAIGRSLSKRAQQRHELKLAKLQREHEITLAKLQTQSRPESTRTPAPVTRPPTITFSPRVIQKTVVKVVNRQQPEGCGCSGCVVIVLVIFIVMVVLAIISSPS